MRTHDAAALKGTVRRHVLAARAALPLEERARGDDARDLVLTALARELGVPLGDGDRIHGGADWSALDRPGHDADGRTAAYVSFGTEPRTSRVLAAETLVPLLLDDRDLDWRAAGGGRPLGVDAVAGCALVLVPALAVDRAGVRLGRGGGSYDRALGRAAGLVVALLHEGELVDELPSEPHDVPVHAVALPSGLVRLR